MHMLDLITIFLVCLLVGNELAVSLFVNPAMWKLEETHQAKALSLLARSLGSVMPFWYVLCLMLLIAETYARRLGTHIHFLYTAVSVWALVILFTVMFLVPINNRIARLDVDALPAHWREQHVKWDRLHRGRILMLSVATICLIWAIIST